MRILFSPPIIWAGFFLAQMWPDSHHSLFFTSYICFSNLVPQFFLFNVSNLSQRERHFRNSFIIKWLPAIWRPTHIWLTFNSHHNLIHIMPVLRVTVHDTELWQIKTFIGCVTDLSQMCHSQQKELLAWLLANYRLPFHSVTDVTDKKRNWGSKNKNKR